MQRYLLVVGCRALANSPNAQRPVTAGRFDTPVRVWRLP